MDRQLHEQLLKGEKEMYKSRVEEFLVGNNINLSVMREESKNESHYVLIKVSLFGKNTYEICVLGDGYALEVIGEDECEAIEFFEILLKNAPSPYHIYDIVSDFRKEKEMME